MMFLAAVVATTLAVNGNPFMAMPSHDGKTLFVSVMPKTRSGAGGIQVVHRDGDRLTMGELIPMKFSLGLSLTPDGKTLFVAAGTSVAVVSAEEAAKDQATPVHYLGGKGIDAIEVQSSADGRYGYFTNEGSATLGVARFIPGAAGSGSLQLIGFVPTDQAPVGMAISSDGRRLYVTSEGTKTGAKACSEGGYASPLGTVRVIDTGKAATDPAHAVDAIVPSGCSPVRVALSLDHRTAWVTARGENHLLVFDTQTMETNLDAARIRTADTGSAPVGLALVDNGRLAIVADSDRFNAQTTHSTIEVFDTAKVLAGQDGWVRTITVGAFPREIEEPPQRDVIYLTNFSSGTVEMIPESLLK